MMLSGTALVLSCGGIWLPVLRCPEPQEMPLGNFPGLWLLAQVGAGDSSICSSSASPTGCLAYLCTTQVAQNISIYGAELCLGLCWLQSELRHPAYMETPACRCLTAPESHPTSLCNLQRGLSWVSDETQEVDEPLLS